MANDWFCVFGPIPKKKRSNNKRATATTIANLPQDLLIEILTRLDIRSILACRCVRRSWNFLLSSSNPEFTELHFARSTGHFILQEPLTLKSKFCIVEVKDEAFDYDIHYSFPKLLPPVDFWVANSCNGLLCLAAATKPYYPVKVCNPITGGYFNLPQHRLNHAVDVVVSGIGLSGVTKKYKVVRWIGTCGGDTIVDRMIEVFTVGTNSWRVVGSVPDNVPSSRGTYLNGAFHWACNNKRGATSDYIISFDLETESFGTVPPPITFSLDSEGPEKFVKTGAVGKFLYLRHNNELWVMKEYGVQDSWVKLYVDDTFLPSYQPIKYFRGGEILMNLGGLGPKLISYDPVKETSKEFKLPKLKCQFGAINYVPSFKPVKDILAEDKSTIRYVEIQGEKIGHTSSSSSKKYCIDDSSDDNFDY